MAPTPKTLAQKPEQAREYFRSKLEFEISAQDLDTILKSGEKCAVIDVRHPDDYAMGHVPGAISLPEEKWEAPRGLLRDSLNVFYCYSSATLISSRAALHFAEKGYSVKVLEGGIDGWRQAELETEKARH